MKACSDSCARMSIHDALTAFKQAGFSDQNALDVVLGVSLATLCNFANNLAKTELNPQMTSYRWESKRS
jgi:alkylhydroperoxidase family enzyme